MGSIKEWVELLDVVSRYQLAVVMLAAGAFIWLGLWPAFRKSLDDQHQAFLTSVDAHERTVAALVTQHETALVRRDKAFEQMTEELRENTSSTRELAAHISAMREAFRHGSSNSSSKGY